MRIEILYLKEHRGASKQAGPGHGEWTADGTLNNWIIGYSQCRSSFICDSNEAFSQKMIVI